jgi:riboflavin kinase / FMN adenylyltransferase
MSDSFRLHRSLHEVPADFGPCALTIGNFDGVHAGHRRILRRVRALAAEHGWKPSALTFDPHPTHVVAPHRAPKLMSTPLERAEWMRQEGIQQVLILPFDKALSQLGAERFVREILVSRLQVKAVLVGENFHFGNRQSGNTSLLQHLGPEYGFITEIVPSMRMRGAMVSSTGIRWLLEQGKVAAARRQLERPYALEGQVVSGFGIGRQQTVPTLNLAPETDMIPGSGVYVTHTYDCSGVREWPSITNVGFRPTFEGQSLTVETYLLSPLEDPTPTRIRVEFLHYLREERRFPTPELLKSQILYDVQRAQAYHRRYERLVCRNPEGITL